MKRPLACVFAATLCLGCQAPPGAIDPFLGRQTVPPPGTATATGVPPSEEYYNGAPKTSANDATSSGMPLSPPGGFKSPSSKNNVATRPESAQPRTSTSGGSATSGGTSVRAADPSDSPPGSTASRSTPASSFQVNKNPRSGLPQAQTASTRSTTVPKPSTTRTTAPQPVKEELPDAKAPPRNDSSGFRRPSGVIRASHEEEVKETRDTAKASSSTRMPRRETIAPGKYDRDRNYRWLKGKLEYTRTDDRWKLRYIPIDGDTDDFGGSVVLLGSRLMEGYKPGEYVTVYGTLGETDSRGNGYAPSYTVDRVARQSEE